MTVTAVAILVMELQSMNAMDVLAVNIQMEEDAMNALEV
jgi:hypothetical protein